MNMLKLNGIKWGCFRALVSAAMVGAAFAANADYEWADAESAIGGNYVKIFNDVGTFSGNLRLVGFSTAAGEFTITTNRVHESANADAAIGELPAGDYVHQLSAGSLFDGTTTKSIRVQLAQPFGSTALYARITAVTTAAGDYSTIPDLRSYMNEAGSSTAPADLAANAVTAITVGAVGDGTDTYTYTASNKPSSLGHGAVKFEYDASGAITRLVVAPTAGRTVEVKGDTLAFAAGGVLAHGGQGEVVISSKMTGVDGLVVTNASGASAFLLYNGDTDGGWIKAKSFSTVYRNTNLDDIEPVEVDNATNSGNRPWLGSNPQVCGIYNVMRDTVDGVKQLVAQVQVAQGGYVKYCKLLMKQDGANVVARNVEALAVKDTDLLGEDFDHLKNVHDGNWSLYDNVEWLVQNPLGEDNSGAHDNLTHSGYGVHRLKSRRIGGLPVLYVNNTIYVNSSGAGLGGPLKVAENIDVRGKTGSSFNTQTMTDGPTFDIDGSLTIPNRNHNLGTPVSGTNGILTVAATQPVSSDPTASVLTGFATYDLQNVDGYIRSLTELVEVEGIMTGKSMPIVTKKSDYNHTQMHHLKIATNGWNDITATCQLQSRNSDTMIRCVKLQLKQADFKVQVAFVTNWYSRVSDGATFGMNFENPGTVAVSGYGTQSLTASSAPSFSVSNLTCRFRLPGQYLLTLSKANTVEDGRLVVKGTSDGGRVMINMNNVGCLPKDGIVDVEEGGTLVFSAGSGVGMNEPGKKSQNSSAKIRVHSGGILRKWAHDSTNASEEKRNHWAIYRAQDIFLDGGTFEPAFLWDESASSCFTYANNVTLRNDALFQGYVNMYAGSGGSADPKSHWYVTGSSPSFCDIPLRFVGGKSDAAIHEFILDVDDTTGDDTADFAFRKPVDVLSSNPNFALGKFGDGIAEAQAEFSVPKGVNVYGGTFRLGVSNVADAGTLKFTLNGGALAAAAGTVNSLGPLTVGENGGGIKLGEGAKLAFADSSAATWPNDAHVTVVGFARGAIKFGDSDAAVPRKRVFYKEDGSRLYIDANGGLTDEPLGIMVILK